MTLRARLALFAAVAVSIAIVAASIVAWALAGGVLLEEIDDRLVSQARLTARVVIQVDQGQRPSADLLSSLQPVPLGVQLVGADGLARSPVIGAPLDLPADDALAALLSGDRDVAVRSLPSRGREWRVASLRLGDGEVLQVARSLGDYQRTLERLAYQLTAVSVAGVALAAGTGWLVARAGLRPVDRVTAAAEEVARTHDLASRIPVRGRDEVARLGRSVNAMLVALDDVHRRQRALVDDAAHELRTPLTVLRADIDMLADRASPVSPAERRDLATELQVTATELSALVDEIVELARGEERVEEPVEVDVMALVREAAARVHSDRHGVAVQVEGLSEGACLPVQSLQRAVTNLVRNAVQASPTGGVVEVDVAGTGSELLVEVADRGPGIDEDERGRIFDRFYRGTGGRDRSGSGLGLAIVRQAADRLGGSVEHRHRAGGGSVFVLRAPRWDGGSRKS